MQSNLIIMDDDKEYVDRLLSAIFKKNNINYNIMSLESIDELRKICLNPNDVMLVSENYKIDIENLIGDYKNIEVYYLSSNKNINESNYIYKYQSITSILDAILKQFNYKDSVINADNKTNLTVIFSPEGLGSTTDLIMKSINKDIKTLYINLTSLPGNELLYSVDGTDLIELLYYSNYSEITFSQIRECIIDIDGVDILLTGNHTLEYSQISENDWINLINKIREINYYEKIIIEIDASICCFVKMLEMASKIYVALAYDSLIKRQRLEKILLLRGYKNLVERILYIDDKQSRNLW